MSGSTTPVDHSPIISKNSVFSESVWFGGTRITVRQSGLEGTRITVKIQFSVSLRNNHVPSFVLTTPTTGVRSPPRSRCGRYAETSKTAAPTPAASNSTNQAGRFQFTRSNQLRSAIVTLQGTWSPCMALVQTGS